MKTAKSVQVGEPRVDIIVVTMDNPTYFRAFLRSLCTFTAEPFRLIIVNNGNSEALLKPAIPHVVIQMSKNEGWMKGVNAGLKWSLENSKAPYIMWINDDIQILDHDYGWLTKMVNCFEIPSVGAVGPVSNNVMGAQTSNIVATPPAIEATRISGMCFLTRRDIVREVGLLDEALPGGDDLDYSIRVRKNHKLCVCRRAFMLHHYASTGRRVHGHYWDSRDHTEAINTALIKKHGFKEWFITVNDLLPRSENNFIEAEDKIVLEELADNLESGLVLDLGCGSQKIHSRAIGIDIRGAEPGVGGNRGKTAAADIVADVSKLPYASKTVDAINAKHILEHILDLPKALHEWQRVLKPGGRLVITVPDYRFSEAISCDPSHVHAFTPESLESMLDEVTGWGEIKSRSVVPGYVFVMTASKRNVLAPFAENSSRGAASSGTFEQRIIEAVNK